MVLLPVSLQGDDQVVLLKQVGLLSSCSCTVCRLPPRLSGIFLFVRVHSNGVLRYPTNYPALSGTSKLAKKKPITTNSSRNVTCSQTLPRQQLRLPSLKVAILSARISLLYLHLGNMFLCFSQIASTNSWSGK